METKRNDPKVISEMQMVMALFGINATEEIVELFIASYEGYLEKGSKFTVEDAVVLKTSIYQKYAERREAAAASGK